MGSTNVAKLSWRYQSRHGFIPSPTGHPQFVGVTESVDQQDNPSNTSEASKSVLHEETLGECK